MPGSKEGVEKGLGTCQSTLNGHKVCSLSTFSSLSHPSTFYLYPLLLLPPLVDIHQPIHHPVTLILFSSFPTLVISINPSSPRFARELANQQDYVLSVAISPDGQWVVSGSKDRSIQFWNIASGQAQFMLQGHKNSVISIDLARSGGYLASGSGDCQARIWKYDPL